MTTEQLKKKIQELQEENIELKGDIKETGFLLLKTLNALGLDKETLSNPQKAKSKMLKTVPSIVADATINPQGLEEKFSHLKRFAPLLEKHKDLIDEIKIDDV